MTKPWLVVIGTRPEGIKMAPVLRAMKARDLPFRVVVTGQHTGLFAQTGFADEFPVEALGCVSANDPLAYVETALGALGASVGPDPLAGVIVQGDTASSVAGGRYARSRGIPLAHVEAGLRSFDLQDPWPEERFRTELDRRAQLLFAPTPLAAANLRSMRSYAKRALIALVGNPVVDALVQAGIRPARLGEHENRVLVTLHRRESFGAPLQRIVSGLIRAAIQHPATEFLWPMHPNPNVGPIINLATVPANVHRVSPMNYLPFVRLLATSRAVLTDSGGVVEEASTLGVPSAIARDRTERQEAVEAKLAILAGRTSDSVATSISQALSMRIEPSNVFGDGHAGERIANVLAQFAP